MTKINFNFIGILFLGFFILLEYKEYNNINQSKNEFYHFIYWFLCVISIGSLYIVYIKVFFLPVKDTYSCFIQTKMFTFEIQYVYKYKLKLFYEYLKIHLDTKQFSMEKKEFIIKTIQTNDNLHLLLNKPFTTVKDIKSYVLIFTHISNKVYENIDILLKIHDDAIFYNSNFYHFYSLIRNTLLIFAGSHAFTYLLLQEHHVVFYDIVKIVLKYYNII